MLKEKSHPLSLFVEDASYCQFEVGKSLQEHPKTVGEDDLMLLGYRCRGHLLFGLDGFDEIYHLFVGSLGFCLLLLLAC